MRSSVSGLPMAVRVSVAGFIVGAAMLAPVWAQPATPKPGAQAPVTITDEDKNKKPAGAETPGAPATPAAAPVTPPRVSSANVKSSTSRDPFITGGTATAAPKGGGGKVVPVVAAKVAKPDAKAAGAAQKANQPPKPEVPPPAVTVSGIVASGSGNRAILTSPTQSYVVKAGDKLGDYRVASIEKNAVNFKFQDKSFKIKIADDMAVTTASKGSKKK